MNLDILTSLGVEQLRNVICIAAMAALAVVLSTYTIVRQRELWIQPVKVVAVVGLVAATSTGLYTYISAVPSSGLDVLLPALQLCRDLPAGFVVPYICSALADQLANVEDRRHLGVPQMFKAAYKVFFVCYVLAVVACASAGLPVGAHLDYSLDPRAVAYRLLIVAPVVFYATLAAVFYGEAYLRERAEPTVHKRYLLFFGGCTATAILSAQWFCWPVLIHYSPDSERFLLLAQAPFWALLGGCWLGALTLPLTQSRTQEALEEFEDCERWIDDISQELHAPSVESEGSLDLRRTADYMVREAAEHLPAEYIPSEDVAAASVSVQLTAKLAQRPGEQDTALSRKISLRHRYKEHLRTIPKDAPHSDHYKDDPVFKAINTVPLLLDERRVRRIAGEPVWVQLAAVVAADLGVLSPTSTRAIFVHEDAAVSRLVWNAYLLAKLSLRAS